jgi:U3 small nucleolar ribonucleoprotein protein IMP4
MKLCIPNAQAINRGNHRMDELVEACKKADFTDVVMLSETRGQPDGLIISHLPFGPTAYFTLSNCVLRHDIPECTPSSEGEMSLFGCYPFFSVNHYYHLYNIYTAYPHLILDNLNTKIGRRVFKVLQALYPVPKSDTRRVVTFKNENDFISFRHHTYTKEKGQIILKENGPRFEMQPYEVIFLS